jgi:hypothetical protein
MSRTIELNRRRVILIAVACWTTCGVFTAQAGTIIISNASFEQPALGEGGSTGAMTDWNLVGPVNSQGIFVNDGMAGFGDIVKNVDGTQLSYIDGKGINGYNNQTDQKLEANITYSITAAVGLQTNSTLDGGNLLLEIAAQKKPKAPLVVAATKTIALAALKKGTLADFSVSFSDGAKFAGQSLYVQIVSDGKATTGDFLVDNLRGSTAVLSAPEPISLGLAAQGFAFIVGAIRLKNIRRRRRSHSTEPTRPQRNACDAQALR